MFNLMIILLSTLNGEPKDSNNYRIAKYIIEHIHEMENCTLSELAAKCYVSNSSISRFCRDIGLGDFNELRTQRAKSWEKAKGLERELAPGSCLLAPPARIELTTNP